MECVVSAKNGKTWDGVYRVVVCGKDYSLAADENNAGKYQKDSQNANTEPKADDYYVYTIFQATQTQLRSGDWGAKIQESIPKGTIVRCRFDDTPALVDPPQYRVIWSNDEFSIAADYDPYYGMESRSPVKKMLNGMRKM